MPGKVDDGSGAVVVSGASDAGGGSEVSVSAAGSGASLFAAPGFADSLFAAPGFADSPFAMRAP